MWRKTVVKIGWQIQSLYFCRPPQFFEVSSSQNKLKFTPKAGKKSSNNFGEKHTSLYLCTPILKMGWQ